MDYKWAAREKEWIEYKRKIAAVHAWTLKNSQKSRMRNWVLQIIIKYLKLYCQHSSLVGIKYPAESQRAYWERILWFSMNCINIFALIFIVASSYQEFNTSPIITSMESDSYRTVDLDFPGIAICPINRISRRAAMGLATKIFNSNTTDLTLDEIYALVEQLGNQYASQFQMETERNEEIDQLLSTYHRGSYDITEIMKALSPHCSAILLKCKLHGTVRNCERLFEFRKTQDGFCCTFNYARESDDIPIMPKVLPPIKVNKVYDLGQERGLSVLIEPFLDDYLYPILPIRGWKVIVFSPYDYPDVSSGGVTEVLATPGTETFLDVTPSSFFSITNVANYPIAKRKCIFPNEQRTMYSGTSYTYSDCIVDCKIHDMQSICGCRPFFYPRRGKIEYAWRICNNADLGCLARHKSKWWTVFPHETSDESIPDNFWALHCHSCYPTCKDTTYGVLSSKSYLSPGYYQTEFLWNLNITNQGVIHVFFSRYGSLRLKQTVAYYWYELVSDIGGICGVFIGFSLISAVELLYFVALAIRDMLFKRHAAENDSRKRDNRKDEMQRRQPISTIYWNELMPRSWQTTTYSFFPKKRIRY